MNLLFLLSLPAAYAADCNDKNLCVGDQTWAFYGGQIHAGVVRSLQPDGKVDFQTNGEAEAVPIAPEKVAVVKAGACPPDSKACVGNQSIRGQGDQAVAGKVLGYFTNDFVVVSENGGAAASLPAKQFTSFTDKPCSADQRICKDDLVFVNDGKALRLIKIDDVDPVSANAMVNGARLPLDRLAPIDQKSCGRDAQGACRSRALTYSSTMPSYIEPVSTPKKR